MRKKAVNIKFQNHFLTKVQSVKSVQLGLCSCIRLHVCIERFVCHLRGNLHHSAMITALTNCQCVRNGRLSALGFVVNV